jgi:hypothetical protein
VSGTAWTPKQLAAVKDAYKNKPKFSTDYELAGLLARQFGKSPEAVRWQLRQLRRTENDVVEPPKILLLDIETMPIEALVFDVWKQDIRMDQIKKDWSIICWSAKWLFDSKVMGQVVTPQEAVAHKDNSVLMKVWGLMNEADWIVTHNGDSFDIKKLYARFFLNNYPKPMYFKSIDTKVIASSTFAFTYNKLDWIAQILGVGRKIETEFEWWKECEAGNPKYLNMMLKYNKWDVNLEEEVYLKLRPWMDKHPTAGLFSNQVGNVCPACGSNDIHWNGKYQTALGLYQAFRCQQCGALGRSTKKAYKLNQSEVQS